MKKIEMVDLRGQYMRIKQEIDTAVISCIDSTAFINGPPVKNFADNLAKYLNVDNVIAVANGTDALQIALMALDLKPGDEVLVPAFTYVATAEVIGLLGLRPLMVDVDANTFNVTAEHFEAALTPKTKAMVPVHLYGQSCEMEPIVELAKKYSLIIIEDTAQALGSDTTFKSVSKKSGTVGHIGCTSFFPSKNLGCFGDGGAIFTDDADLAKRMRMVANHGQIKKYYHSVIGVNSRLDSIQAAILDVKLRYLDDYCEARRKVARRYSDAFSTIPGIQVPVESAGSTHVYHQYTIRVMPDSRERLKEFLAQREIPSMIYYPLPLYRQEAFSRYVASDFSLPITEELCRTVLSLPIHTEMSLETQDYIIDAVLDFFSEGATA